MLKNRIKLLIYSLIIVLTGISCSGRKVTEQEPRADLGETLDSIIASHDGITGVAVLSGDSLLVAGDSSQLPLMSVFKMHIAIAVLDKGIAIDSVVSLGPSDVRENTYSPMRDEKRTRSFDITVDSLMYYSVCRSDNNACDFLIDLAGGIGEVDRCIRRLGINDFALAETENSMHEDLVRCYNNRSTLEALCRVIEAVFSGRALSPESTQYLAALLGKSSTGLDKIASGIAPEAFLGHKSGMSDRNADGIRMATGDVAAFTRPDGSTAYIAILVKDSSETDGQSSALFKELSAAVFDAYCR